MTIEMEDAFNEMLRQYLWLPRQQSLSYIVHGHLLHFWDPHQLPEN